MGGLRRCETAVSGTAEHSVWWVLSLVFKGNNVVFPHHHPRAKVQEIIARFSQG